MLVSSRKANWPSARVFSPVPPNAASRAVLSAKTGIPVLNAFKTAERSHGQTDFVIETQHLILKLNGNPGDGALEVLKNLKSDTAMLNSFIEKWRETTVYEYRNVIQAIEAVYNELIKLQIIVDQAPPVFLKRNELSLRKMSGKS